MNASTGSGRIKAALDENNPFGLVAAIKSDALKAAMKKVPESYWGLEEAVLREQAKPTRTDYALRMALWNELRIAHARGEPVKASRIYEGICSYQHWWSNVLNVPEKLAWLLCPLQDYTRSLEPLLVRIAERYQEILDMDVRDSKGRINPALLKIQVETMKAIEGRLLGAAVQRTESKNLSVQLRAGGASVEGFQLENATMEELEQRIRQLEALEKRALHLPEFTET
jgi:hypothetical protein